MIKYVIAINICNHIPNVYGNYYTQTILTNFKFFFCILCNINTN